MKKYLVSLLILVSILSLILSSISGKLADWQQTLAWYILVYFAVVTGISHLGLERTTKARPQVFVRYYMASTSIRLLAAAMAIEV